MKAIRLLLDVVIAAYLLALIAFLVTGGFSFDFFGLTVSAQSFTRLWQVLIPAVLLRLALTIHWTNTLLVLASTLLALLVAEAVLRWWNPAIAQPALTQIHRPSVEFDWELIPGSGGVGVLGEDIRINSAGMRDRERIQPRPSDKKRIAVVGDSFTFGVGVSLDQTYAKQLEDTLARQQLEVDVLNFGVIGYQLWQYLKVLRTGVQQQQPDWVVFGMFADDIGICRPPYETNPGWKPSNPFELANEDKFTASYALNLGRNLYAILETRLRYHRGHRYLQGMEKRRENIVESPGTPMYRHMYGTNPEKLYQDCLEVFREIGVWSREHDIPVVFAVIPDAAQVGEPELQHFNRFVQEAANKNSLGFVDATARFEAHPDPKTLYLFPLDAHTSVEGHRLIAETIASAIEIDH